MNAWKKVACAALALAMLLVAGCSNADLSWAYRAGDIQPPVGVYIFYMLSANTAAETEWHELYTADEADHEHPPYKEMLSEELPDGSTYEAFMLADAEKSMREYIAVERRFAENGLSLTEEENTYASNTAASAWAGDEEGYTRLGIAESSLRLVILNQLKREALFQASYGVSGDLAVSESELRETFARDYALVEMMFFHAGESGDTADAVKEAAEYQKRLDEGEDIYDLIYEYDLAAAAADGDADADTGVEVERPAEGSRAVILSESDRANYGDTLTDAALATEVGGSAVATEGSYVYLLQRSDILENILYFESYRSEVLHSLKEEEFEELLTGWAEEITVETNTAALERYQPSKLKMEA